MTIHDFWRRRGVFNVALLPLAAVFGAAANARRHWLTGRQAPAAALLRRAPVIVVGNISVGGGGKTPVVIALAKALAARGKTPGIISRGYGGNYSGGDSYMVSDDSDWRLCGDEALMMRRRAGVAVCVGKNRVAAARRLIAEAGCDVIISDDGLQHYALPRALELCVINGRERFGNGWLLPAGPLRELPARIWQCDYRLLTYTAAANTAAAQGEAEEPGFISVWREAKNFYALGELGESDTPYTADFFAGQRVIALAGTAYPNDFFNTLEALGIALHKKIALPDHSDHGEYNNTDLQNAQNENDACLIMTEKDAVKYRAGKQNAYALRLDCVLPDSLIDDIAKKLKPEGV